MSFIRRLFAAHSLTRRLSVTTTRRTMTTTTIASLQRITAKDLSELILAEAEAPTRSYAIVDVRDDDHIGGHIKGSDHIPSRTLDAALPNLLARHADKTTIVFHCALSQQRGPTAALRYLREVERAKKNGSKAKTTSTNDEDEEGGKTGEREQKVVVLDRGFVGWQEVYGEDERLTEGYRKELWKDGYWG